MSATIQTAQLSHPGRRARNEDSCGYQTSEQSCCWIVSDGAGGHGSGDVASQMVVRTILDNFVAQLPATSETAAALLEAAQNAVMSHKAAHPEGDNMHATATVLLIDSQTLTAAWGHVGDTRVYLFRERRVVFQTRDHSVVQQFIDAGYGDTSIIRAHPHRSLLTAAIGNADELTISVSGPPVQLIDGDVLLICSDGWWELLEERVMEAMLEDSSSVAEWLNSMARRIELNMATNSDNFSAIAVQIGEIDPVITQIQTAIVGA
ncbi:PP2C family protein-serine/threonine phosphatase [Viridibacterium curvum]